MPDYTTKTASLDDWLVTERSGKEIAHFMYMNRGLRYSCFKTGHEDCSKAVYRIEPGVNTALVFYLFFAANM